MRQVSCRLEDEDYPEARTFNGGGWATEDVDARVHRNGYDESTPFTEVGFRSVRSKR
jgi:hypothetical protein